jgi:hypothetical protein
MNRLEVEHQAEVERLQREVDGVEEPGEGPTAKSKRATYKEKNTIVKVVAENDEDQGKLAMVTGVLDLLVGDTSYNVRAHKAGTKMKPAFKGEDLEIVHLKPVWLTPEGLRRLDQWQGVLDKVQDLSNALHLPSTYLSTLAIDPLDFLFNHWLGVQTTGPDVDQKERTSTTTIVAWLQARAKKSERKDAVRENIKRRCDTLKTNSSEALMKFFDALLHTVKSKAVTGAANEAFQCADRDVSALAAPKESDSDDDAAWDDSDSDDGEDGEKPFMELGSTVSALLQAAVAALAETDEKGKFPPSSILPPLTHPCASSLVATASFRVLSRLPRVELRKVLEDSGAADVAEPSTLLTALLAFNEPSAAAAAAGETIFDPFAFKSPNSEALAYESQAFLDAEDARIRHVE